MLDQIESADSLSLISDSELSRDGIHYRPLVIATHHVLLNPTNGPHHHCTQDTKSCGDKLPRQYKQTKYAELTDQLDPLVDLIEVILILDVVTTSFVGMMRCRIGYGNKLQDSRQLDASSIKREDPYTEELM